MKERRFRVAAWLLFVGVCLTLLQANIWADKRGSRSDTTASASPQPASDTAVRLGPDDALAIVVVGEDKLTGERRISSSGVLDLPLVGTVPAAGLTVEQLDADLRRRLAEYIRDPKVSVRVAEWCSRPVTVGGAVHTPGVYQLNSPLTVFDVLVKAGGVLDDAASVVLTRRSSSGPIDFPGMHQADSDTTSVSLDLGQVMSGVGEQAHLAVKPYDSISVEKKVVRLVYVAGEVNHPGAIELQSVDHVLVSQAVAMAGGVKPSGASKKSILWKFEGSSAQRQTEVLNLSKILKGQVADPVLEEGDYLVVPPRGGFSSTALAISSLMSPMVSMSFILGRI